MAILYKGDCNEEMHNIDDNSIDCIFTDLPYAQLDGVKWDKMIDLEAMWVHFMRIKKNTTPIFFTCNTKFGVHLINSAPKKCPFRYEIVWKKSNPVGHLSCGWQPLRNHELIYVFYENKPYYDLSSHMSKVVKENGNNRYGTCYSNKQGKIDKNVPVKKYDPPLPLSIIEIPTKRNGFHPTEKPVALMKYFFKYFTKEGDVVLDNCMGSGSTGVACKEMGLNFIGIESNDAYFETAYKRIYGE